ncbi:MAG TPA: hypothetical protein VGD13_09165, partial [Xanthobacteraceae bacterium]
MDKHDWLALAFVEVRNFHRSIVKTRHAQKPSQDRCFRADPWPAGRPLSIVPKDGLTGARFEVDLYGRMTNPEFVLQPEPDRAQDSGSIRPVAEAQVKGC